MGTIRYDIDKLREDMALRGWLSRDLARAAGVSDTSVSRFLNGERPSPRMAAKFAHALGTTIRRYLLRRAA